MWFDWWRDFTYVIWFHTHICDLISHTVCDLIGEEMLHRWYDYWRGVMWLGKDTPRIKWFDWRRDTTSVISLVERCYLTREDTPWFGNLIGGEMSCGQARTHPESNDLIGVEIPHLWSNLWGDVMWLGRTHHESVFDWWRDVMWLGKNKLRISDLIGGEIPHLWFNWWRDVM